MKKITLGMAIRNYRDLQGMSRTAAARRVGISKGFFGHLENDAPVHLSDALAEKLVERIRVPVRVMNRLRKAQAAKRARWMRDHKPAKRKH